MVSTTTSIHQSSVFVTILPECGHDVSISYFPIVFFSHSLLMCVRTFKQWAIAPTHPLITSVVRLE